MEKAKENEQENEGLKYISKRRKKENRGKSRKKWKGRNKEKEER